jgi:hypothetical protein
VGSERPVRKVAFFIAAWSLDMHHEITFLRRSLSLRSLSCFAIFTAAMFGAACGDGAGELPLDETDSRELAVLGQPTQTITFEQNEVFMFAEWGGGSCTTPSCTVPTRTDVWIGIPEIYRDQAEVACWNASKHMYRLRPGDGNNVLLGVNEDWTCRVFPISQSNFWWDQITPYVDFVSAGYAFVPAPAMPTVTIGLEPEHELVWGSDVHCRERLCRVPYGTTAQVEALSIPPEWNGERWCKNAQGKGVRIDHYGFVVDRNLRECRRTAFFDVVEEVP